MRNKNVLSFIFLSLFGISALIGSEPPTMSGDNETMEITIGEARKALWYKGQYDVQVEYIKKLEGREALLSDLTDALRTDAAKARRQLSLTLGIGGFTLGLLAGIVIVDRIIDRLEEVRDALQER